MFDGISFASRLTKAIAFAEGCIDKHENYNKLSLPYRLNNPCDLKVTSSQFTHHTHPSGKLIFADIGIGWNAGQHQVDLMLTNKSLIYKNTMTIQQVANHYAKEHSTVHDQTNADNWAKNVASFLGVTPEYTLIQLMDIKTYTKVMSEPQQPVDTAVQVSTDQPKSSFAQRLKKGE